MSAKYNFSIQLGFETFQVTGCDSFDEAIKIVEKGVYDRKLKIENETKNEIKIEKEPEIKYNDSNEGSKTIGTDTKPKDNLPNTNTWG